MRVGLSQTARMDQRLIQSPQMIQAMQILQLSALELEARIAQELEENPFLQVEEGGDDGDGESDGAPTDAPDAGEKEQEREAVALDGMIEELERYERDYGDGRRVASTEDGDRKLEAMQNTPSSYHSLGDALMDQFVLSDLDERRRTIAEFICYSLDAHGYLTDEREDVASACGVPDVTLEELEEVIEVLRVATHPGLAARNLSECLLLQLEPMGIDSPLVRTLITEHFEDITTNRLPRIARATGYSIEEVKAAIETIRTLDPVPGREYGELPAETIHPDVVVEEIDGKFETRLTREGVPDLAISAAYRRLLRQVREDTEKKWIKQRVESARWFVEAVEQRQSTLLRISKGIFDRQAEFLERGVKSLAPLRMLEIAEVAGVHISTVSRAVAGKYAQTPHGILPLRYFFSGGTAKESGGMASQASIKQRIKELVDKEDSQAPLSDDRLAEVLKEKEGISIARRTITKYRKALGIPSSSQRREF